MHKMLAERDGVETKPSNGTRHLTSTSIQTPNVRYGTVLYQLSGRWSDALMPLGSVCTSALFWRSRARVC